MAEEYNNFLFEDLEIAESQKSSLRRRADSVKEKRCRYLLAVLEYPGNFSNVGAVIRNIDGLGISKLYIVGHSPNGKKHRRWIQDSSVGAAKHVYVRYFDTTEKCLEHLHKRGYKSLVTSPHQKGKKNIPLREGRYTKYGKLAVWFGNESSGISHKAINGSDGCINIDMCGIVESLNLAVSTGLVMHHIASQKREYWQAKKNKRISDVH
uniref:rRNA methylase family protein n=1 Tax=Marseillevirus LCMAC101 TaxID=2506602 RepID=A0A481YS54_9VIRU|nr:MAG: rRNA methylase family protein [Marseillevirus LCMAC101]